MTTETRTARMEQVYSADGTRIAYRRSGQGSPLLLVHGSTADHTRWAPVVPALEEFFTVFALDRRGRGVSDDAPTYAIEREFEDIVAVVNAIGGPVSVLGHSYGALCALEAALRTDCIRRLVLYEPPIPAGVAIFPRAAVNRVRTQLEAGDRDGALVTFFREIVRTPPQDLELLRSLGNWPARVAMAHTIPREMDSAEAYGFEAERFRRMLTPALLLTGGESPPAFTSGVAAVHAALPVSRIAVLPGQQHIAMSTAPDLFVSAALPFLTAG